MRNEWMLASNNGLYHQGQDTFLETKTEVNNKTPLGVTGEGEETKKFKEKLSWSLTSALFMERCITAFTEKITWHQQFPRRAK